MASLSAFAHLLAVDARNRALAEVTSGLYSVALYGLVATAMHSPFFADNPRLKDLGNILEIQARSDNGTYVADNDVLCFLSSLLWTRRANSNISYRLDQVADRFNLRLLMMRSATRRVQCIPRMDFARRSAATAARFVMRFPFRILPVCSCTRARDALL